MALESGFTWAFALSMKRYLSLVFLFPLLLHAQEDSVKRMIKKEDVIVTTTRTSERKIEMPLAISAVPPEAYKDSRGYELKDALWSVPGVLAQSRGGHTDLRITIRGYGARGAGDRSNAGNMRGIRVLLDGIPETEPDGRTVLDMVDLFNIDGVEVLRSNGSTLYGSASGGVISLSTPSGFPNSYLETRNNFGSFGFRKNAAMAGAKTDRTTVFASASGTSYDGYREHSSSTAGNFYLNISSALDTATHLGITAGGVTNLIHFPGALTWDQFQADPSQADSVYVARDERRFDRVGRMAVKADHAFGGGQSVSATAYIQPRIITRSERNTYRDFNRYNLGTNAQYNWIADFAEGIRGNFIGGFDQQYQDGTILFYSLAPGGTRGTELKDNKTEPVSNIGFYAQEELRFERFEIMAGGRYDLITYSSQDIKNNIPKQSKAFKRFTPKASVGYFIDNNNTVYALLGGGVEAPAFNEVNPPSKTTIDSVGGVYDSAASAFNPLLEPIVSTSYELGCKGIVQATSLVMVGYDVALFNITIDNDLVPWEGGAAYLSTAKTSRLGAEAALNVFTDFGLSLRTAATLMDSKYEEYRSDKGVFDGNKTAGIPPFFANARLRYDAILTRGIRGFVEGGVEHVGKYYADDRNDKQPNGSPDPNTRSLVPAYTIFNATFGLNAGVGHFDLTAFVSANNLTDDKYVASAFINGINNKYFEPGMARNITGGFGVKYRFVD